MTDARIPTTPSAEGRHRRTRRVHIRLTNPSLYWSVTVFALISVALGVNFWTSHPTFNPFGWPKNLVGCGFFLIGASLLALLNVIRDLRWLRRTQGISVGAYFLWGVVNSQQFFHGKASLQLPIVFVGLCVLQAIRALEPPVNPLTEKR